MTAPTPHTAPRASSGADLEPDDARPLPRREIHLQLEGPFDAQRRAHLRSAATACTRGHASGSSRLHLDLEGLTALDDLATHCLNEAWELFTRRGWSVVVTPPAAPDARAYFIGAAVAGQLAWARRGRRRGAGPRRP